MIFIFSAEQLLFFGLEVLLGIVILFALWFLIKLSYIVISMNKALSKISDLEQDIKNVRQQIQEYNNSRR